jgi:nucleotide-binding universal stress UspA family protein
MPKLGDTASGSGREMSLSTKARRGACSHGWTYSGPTGSDQPSLNGNGAEKALTHGRAAGTIERIDVSDARETFTIVLGYDGSESARRGVERVRRLAVERPTVVVVAVAPEVRSAGLATELLSRAVDTDLLLAEAGELLATREDAAIQGRSAVGDPAVVLIDVAREVAADLIIVGRRGRDFVARTLHGPVAERVVQLAPCDVLVVT